MRNQKLHGSRYRKFSFNSVDRIMVQGMSGMWATSREHNDQKWNASNLQSLVYRTKRYSAPSSRLQHSGTTIMVQAFRRNTMRDEVGVRVKENAAPNQLCSRGLQEVEDDPLAGVDKENTDIMMYCTGGIRCDVYSTILRYTPKILTINNILKCIIDGSGRPMVSSRLAVFI